VARMSPADRNAGAHRTALTGSGCAALTASRTPSLADRLRRSFSISRASRICARPAATLLQKGTAEVAVNRLAACSRDGKIKNGIRGAPAGRTLAGAAAPLSVAAAAAAGAGASAGAAAAAAGAADGAALTGAGSSSFPVSQMRSASFSGMNLRAAAGFAALGTAQGARPHSRTSLEDMPAARSGPGAGQDTRAQPQQTRLRRGTGAQARGPRPPGGRPGPGGGAHRGRSELRTPLSGQERPCVACRAASAASGAVNTTTARFLICGIQNASTSPASLRLALFEREAGSEPAAVHPGPSWCFRRSAVGSGQGVSQRCEYPERLPPALPGWPGGALASPSAAHCEFIRRPPGVSRTWT